MGRWWRKRGEGEDELPPPTEVYAPPPPEPEPEPTPPPVREVTEEAVSIRPVVKAYVVPSSYQRVHERTRLLEQRLALARAAGVPEHLTNKAENVLLRWNAALQNHARELEAVLIVLETEVQKTGDVL